MGNHPAMLLILLLMGAVVPLLLFMAVRRRKRGLAQSEEALDDTRKPGDKDA